MIDALIVVLVGEKEDRRSVECLYVSTRDVIDMPQGTLGRVTAVGTQQSHLERTTMTVVVVWCGPKMFLTKVTEFGHGGGQILNHGVTIRIGRGGDWFRRVVVVGNRVPQFFEPRWWSMLAGVLLLHQRTFCFVKFPETFRRRRHGIILHVCRCCCCCCCCRRIPKEGNIHSGGSMGVFYQWNLPPG